MDKYKKRSLVKKLKMFRDIIIYVNKYKNA